MKIINITRNIVLADNAVMADTALTRLRGLLGRKGLKEGEALVIRPSNSIHMFFMRFAIDALFVDRYNKVVGVCNKMQPWSVSPVFWKSFYVVELAAGVIDAIGTGAGDEIELS
jgi:uncharacterized membrane protein (UPF0127 family)